MTNFPRPSGRARSARLPEAITIQHVDFIGEAVGVAEDSLKTLLRRIFAQSPQVIRRAYLAQISLGEPTVSSVVLCLRYRADIETTLANGFSHMFSELVRQENFYDVLALDEAREQELRKLCVPFFETV